MLQECCRVLQKFCRSAAGVLQSAAGVLQSDAEALQSDAGALQSAAGVLQSAAECCRCTAGAGMSETMFWTVETETSIFFGFPVDDDEDNDKTHKSNYLRTMTMLRISYKKRQ